MRAVIICAVRARFTRQPCRRICRLRRTKSFRRMWQPRKRARSSTFTPGTKKTDRPNQTTEAFGRFRPRIKQQNNTVINVTSGGQSLHESGGTGKGRQRIITGGYWVAAQSASSQMMPAGIVLQCGISKIARVAACDGAAEARRTTLLLGQCARRPSSHQSGNVGTNIRGGFQAASRR